MAVTLFVSLLDAPAGLRVIRVNHERGELERFLGSLEPGSPVALEAGLNWMWMVEQIEKANLEPQLTNPLEAKKRMGGVNKLDSRAMRRVC